MQIAAVIAARLMPNEPNGASSSVARPVLAITGDTGAVTPAARCAATPGRFCDAIVTRNSGSPRPIAAARLNSGITNCGRAQPHCTPASAMRPENAAIAMPTSSTPGTAKRGQKRRPSTKTSAIVATSAASPRAASAASRPKRVSTPASSAAAIATGTRSISRSNSPDAPAIVISTAETMNAPVATGNVMPCVAASSAAPGVDHAVSTGWRYQSDRPMLVRPVPTPSAHIHEVVCSGVAPRPCAAWNTMATELVKPTSTAMKPATTAENETSLSMGRSVPDRGRARFCRTNGSVRVGRPRKPAAFSRSDATRHVG